MFNETFNFGVGASVHNFWAGQDPAQLDAAAAVIKAHGANPWVFAADERHFEQFAGAADRAALEAMPKAACRALLGHWA